jgi:Uma2 family endonuclease
MAQPAWPSASMMTVEAFLALKLPEGKAELVRGELRMTPPAGGPHGLAATNLVLLLGTYVKQHSLGRVFADGFGYELTRLPRTVRVPDGSFVVADRLAKEGIAPGLLKLAPDLAIEVLSPSETASELEEKLNDYFDAGTPLVWIVDPSRRAITIVAADRPRRWLHEGDTLSGDPVVDGFPCAIADVFDGIARS